MKTAGTVRLKLVFNLSTELYTFKICNENPQTIGLLFLVTLHMSLHGLRVLVYSVQESGSRHCFSACVLVPVREAKCSPEAYRSSSKLSYPHCPLVMPKHHAERRSLTEMLQAVLQKHLQPCYLQVLELLLLLHFKLKFFRTTKSVLPDRWGLLFSEQREQHQHW